MTFTQEYIPEEDKKKYGHDSIWTIDRERGVFLISSGLNRERGMTFYLYRCSDGNLLLRAEATEISIKKVPESDNPADGFIRRYEVSKLFIPESFKNNSVDNFPLLEEAIIEDCGGLPNKKFRNIEVEVTLSNQLKRI